MKTCIRTYWDYKAVLEILTDMDFELLVGTNEDGDLVLKLHDVQGANLGGIEAEEFNDFDEVIDRLDMYFYDYIVSDLEELFADKIAPNSYATCYDLYNRIVELPYEDIEKDEWEINMLGLWVGAYNEMGH